MKDDFKRQPKSKFSFCLNFSNFNCFLTTILKPRGCTKMTLVKIIDETHTRVSQERRERHVSLQQQLYCPYPIGASCQLLGNEALLTVQKTFVTKNKCVFRFLAFAGIEALVEFSTTSLKFYQLK